jgi:MarR family transcriptional regulator, transcriptional regulator for hemolysin
MGSMTNQSMPKQAQVGLLLAAVRRRQRQAVEARVGCLGLSTQQFWVLEAVLRRGECALADILAMLPMDQPTASRVLSALQERRLVELESDMADRRRRCVRLTAQGTRLAQHCATIAKQIRKAVLVGFSPKDIETLSDLLTRMVDNLDHLDEVAPPETAKTSVRALAKPRSGGSYRARL